MLNKGQTKRLLSVLLALGMLLGTAPAYALTDGIPGNAETVAEANEEPEGPGGLEGPEPAGTVPMSAVGLLDSNMHGSVPGYGYDYNAPDSHIYKYFKIYEHGTLIVLGEGSIGGESQYRAPMIPDGRRIAFEFLNEKTQEIRLELWDSVEGEPGNYLGLISCGIAQGQWGVLGREEWHIHSTEEGDIVPVANYLIWDGLYWDTARQEFIFPGQDENGGIEPGVYQYFVRFQPTAEATHMFTVDVRLAISYTEEDIARLLQLRSLFGLGCDGDPVSMISGNFTWDYTDISVFGARPLAFARHYNALDKNGGELGFGWRHSYMYSIDRTLVFADLVLPNGYRVSYNVKGDGSFAGPDGVDYYLEGHDGGYRMTDRALTQHFFDGNGRLTAIEDIGGNRTEIARNGAEISSISSSSGTLAFAYSGGRISSITDQTGRSVHYGYDGSGDLVSFRNADDDTIDYAYDDKHRITAISDFNGNTYLRNAYDSLGRVKEQHVADQGTSLFSYDVANRASTISDPNGAVRKYYYDLNQNVTAAEDVNGQTRYEYDGGRITRVTDRLGNSTSYAYDAAGNVTDIAYPDGTAEHYAYNSLNLVTEAVAKDGAVSLYGYDERGNMTSHTDARGNSSHYAYDGANNMLASTDAMGATTVYTYDPKGNCLARTDPLGNRTSFAYDGQGRLVLQENADGGTVGYEYTSAGKLARITDPAGNETEYFVSGNGYETGHTDPMGFSASTIYNEQNKPISVTDAEGNTTVYSYDAVGQIVRTTDALGNTVSYGYDLAGRIASMADARGNSWSFSYDAEGRMTGSTDPLGNTASTAFDTMGRAASATNARNATTSYLYDAAGRIARITDALGNSSRNAYDANGNLVEQYDRNGNRWSYAYNGNNLMTEARDPLGYVTTYVYDANGQCTKTVSALGAQPQQVYDSMGRLTKSIDAGGNETLYGYDILGRLVRTDFADGTFALNEYNANGWLAKATAQDGGETSYAYNKNGQILTVVDALGGVTSYEYDALGRATSVTDALNGVTSYEYDANGNLLCSTDALGGATVYAYDELNRVVSMTDPLGGETLTEYDANGNVSKVTNADGGAIAYSYDLLDRLAGYVDAEGHAFGFAYDANGNATGTVDGRGNSASTEYDGLNRAVKRYDQIGNPISVAYDADGRMVKAVNAEGAETHYRYGPNGNVAKVTDALGNATLFTYDSMGRVATMTDARGAVTAYAYTAAGRVAAVTDALGGTSRYAYDLLGRRLSESNPLGETTSYTYDALGRALTVTDPLGNTDSFAYDALGRIKAVTDKNGNVTRYRHDANGNIIETIDALNNSSYFGYDAMDRLVKVTLYRKDSLHSVNEAQVTLYSYDKRGLVTREINAAGGETVYVYDGNGNMVQKIDADGYVTGFGYDPRNLAEQINYSGGKEAQFAYNANGELVAMVDWNGTVSFALDVLGRIASVNDHNGKATGYAYDAVGNRTGIEYPDGSAVEYSHDLLGRLTNVKDAEGQDTAYAYDAASKLVSQAYPNGWNETYRYDAAGRLVRQYSEAPSGKATDSVEHRYSYDPQGNVLAEYRSGAGGQDRFNLAHAYDALGRLAKTTGDQGYKARAYAYDSLGNLTYELVHNKGTEYWHNSLNQQVKKVVDKKDAYTYGFDGRGNLVEGKYHKNQNHSYAVESYVYDATNRMVKGTNEAGEQSFYIYNGLGYLVANEWIIDKNGYGYTGADCPASPQVGGVVVCDRHSHVTGNGHVDPAGRGHTTGGTSGGADPGIGAHRQAVHKDYVLDYTSALKNVIMEYESGAGGLAYRYVYGLEKASAVVAGIPNGAGSVMQYAYYDGLGGPMLATERPGRDAVANGIVKLWYHHDRLGSVDYLTDNVAGKVTSYVTYDDYGAPTAKAVLKVGVRELDLVTQYTVHPYDHVLGVYFTQARMYDAADRRFLAVDWVKGYIKTPQSLAPYTYVLDNPLRFIDPSGLDYIVAWSYGGGEVSEFNDWLLNNGFTDKLLSETGDWTDTMWAEFGSRSSFARAAQTRVNDLIAMGIPANEIHMRRIDSSADFESAWADWAKIAVVEGLDVYSHGYGGGPEVRGRTDVSMWNRVEILNWTSTLRQLTINGNQTGYVSTPYAAFHGCHTANGDFIQAFANRQGVVTYGSTGYTSFSTKSGSFASIKTNSTSTPVYLGVYKEIRILGIRVAKTSRVPMKQFCPVND